MTTAIDLGHMRRALDLAARGRGGAEPNPLVGCVIARDAQVVGEGWHARCGGPHAEVEALLAAGAAASGATLYVTLEPCCHHGKTPPCTEAVIAAGIRRVVAAHADPFPRVNGGGVAQLRAAGLTVEVGLLAAAAQRLNAPYLKLLSRSRPWLIAKWAMTWDGKIATGSGSSQWISGPASRAIVHQLRGRMDAIMVGRGTAATDDPLLTARPAGLRIATRIVVDSQASLAPESQLVRTARQVPVLVAVGPEAPAARCRALAEAGCEVWAGESGERATRLLQLLDELGRRQMTNVLVEGGTQLLGSLFDASAIDEVHAFLAPKVVGGQEAPSPIAGRGVALMADAIGLETPEVQAVGADLYLQARVLRAES